MVYIPRVVWLSMEGGLMKFLVIISFCWWKVYDWVFARNVLLWQRFFIAGKKCSRQDCGRCSGEEGSADTDIQSIFVVSTNTFHLSKMKCSLQVHLHNKYTKYAFLFFLCELLNLFVVVVIVFLIDRSVFIPQRCLKTFSRFLNYSFLGYGYGVWRYYSLPHEERRFSTLHPLFVPWW